ncbi:MAG: hypothetical protein ACKVPJ_10160, partial [Chitinophagales bacterium]
MNRIDVITDDGIVSDGWYDDEGLSTAAPTRKVHPDLVDMDSNNKNETDKSGESTLSNNTENNEQRLRHDIHDWMSSVIQDFDATTTESQLMLCTVAIAFLMIFVLFLWIIVRIRRSSMRRTKGQISVTESHSDNVPDLVMQKTDLTDIDLEQYNDSAVLSDTDKEATSSEMKSPGERQIILWNKDRKGNNISTFTPSIQSNNRSFISSSLAKER